MAGTSPVEEQDNMTIDRITFRVQYDCSRLGQTAGEWLVAKPPLHGCQWSENGRLGLGPADTFAKTVAQADGWTESEIGLVPNAIPGVSINVFNKDAGPPPESYQTLPPGYQNAYDMMLTRSKAAQEQGRIRGILFHQGETDCGQADWVDRVANVVSNLRADLGLTPEDAPFIAGELPTCQNHNPLVNQLPDKIPYAAAVSAQGTSVHDPYHFDAASARLMGQRYAEKFLEMVPKP